MKCKVPEIFEVHHVGGGSPFWVFLDFWAVLGAMPSTRPLNPGRPSKGFLPPYWSHSLNFKDEIAKYLQNLQKVWCFVDFFNLTSIIKQGFNKLQHQLGGHGKEEEDEEEEEKLDQPLVDIRNHAHSPSMSRSDSFTLSSHLWQHSGTFNSKLCIATQCSSSCHRFSELASWSAANWRSRNMTLAA